MKDKIYNIISDQLNIPLERITPESTFKALSAGWFDIIETITIIEDEFNIEIPDERFDESTTIASLVAYVQRQTEGK